MKGGDFMEHSYRFRIYPTKSKRFRYSEPLDAAASSITITLPSVSTPTSLIKRHLATKPAPLI